MGNVWCLQNASNSCARVARQKQARLNALSSVDLGLVACMKHVRRGGIDHVWIGGLGEGTHASAVASGCVLSSPREYILTCVMCLSYWGLA